MISEYQLCFIEDEIKKSGWILGKMQPWNQLGFEQISQPLKLQPFDRIVGFVVKRGAVHLMLFLHRSLWKYCAEVETCHVGKLS